MEERSRVVVSIYVVVDAMPRREGVGGGRLEGRKKERREENSAFFSFFFSLLVVGQTERQTDKQTDRQRDAETGYSLAYPLAHSLTLCEQEQIVILKGLLAPQRETENLLDNKQVPSPCTRHPLDWTTVQYCSPCTLT